MSAKAPVYTGKRRRERPKNQVSPAKPPEHDLQVTGYRAAHNGQKRLALSGVDEKRSLRRNSHMNARALLASTRALLAAAGFMVSGPLSAETFNFEALPVDHAPSGFTVALTGGGEAPTWVVVAAPAKVTGTVNIVRLCLHSVNGAHWHITVPPLNS
jgi:hypothetical protein